MPSIKSIRLLGSGSYVPEKILTNDGMKKIVETNDEWIRTRTGIHERRIASEEQACSDLCLEASYKALKEAKVKVEDIHLIIVATMTPDKPFPNTAIILQKKLKASNAACFSMEVACAGFIYAMEVAISMLNSGNYKTALVVGGEKLSSIVNWCDRGTCILFGDGAGALVLQKTDDDRDFLVESVLYSDGNFEEDLHIPIGGSAVALSEKNIGDDGRYLMMNGNQVYREAILGMFQAAMNCLKQANLTIDDIDYLIPHQANIRIIKSLQKRLNFPDEKVFINIHKYGNTSAASVPIAFDELRKEKKLSSGQKIMSVAFGGGFAWGANIIEI